MPVPILLVGNYPADGQESMLRFERLLREELAARGWPVEALAPSAHFGGRGPRPAYTGLGKWRAYLDKFLVFPQALRRRARSLGPGGIVHICDHSNAMYATASAGRPVLVTCHDLGAVRGALGEATDCPASATGKILQRWIRRSLGHADLIACVSTATRQDVERLVRRPDNSAPHTRLVLNGLNVPYRPLEPSETAARFAAAGLDAGMEFVLNVGSSLRRKNRDGVLRIFADLRDRWPAGRLVFAGEPLPAELRELAARLGLAERVIEVVKPFDGLLEALYNRARALLFPSRFEGFGWPVIEAQACGCPVLCSDAGSLAEVGGAGAFVRPAANETAFAAELWRLCAPGPDAATARAQWAAAGFRNAEQFSARAMVDRYLALYEELAGRPPVSP